MHLRWYFAFVAGTPAYHYLLIFGLFPEFRMILKFGKDLFCFLI